MGRPAARFLASISSDYALGKLWGMGTDLYDETTARNNLKSYLLRERRDGDLGKEEARELWNELVDVDLDNEHAHVLFVYGCDYWRQVHTDGYGPNHKIRNPQAQGFWETLWPAFIAELGGCAAPVTLATVKPPRNMRIKVPAVAEIKECTNG